MKRFHITSILLIAITLSMVFALRSPAPSSGGGGSGGTSTSSTIGAFATTNTDLATALTLVGLTNLLVTNCLFVNPTAGSDVTGVRGNPTKPFRTIGYWQNDIVGSALIGDPNGNVYFTRTGALANARGGDTLILSAGYHTNYAAVLWQFGINANGVSMIGAGVGSTYLVPQRTPQNDLPAQCVLGPFLQVGNNTRCGNFTIIPDSSGTLTLSTNNIGTPRPLDVFMGFGPDPVGATGGSQVQQNRSFSPESVAIGGDAIFTNSDWEGYTNAMLFNINFPSGSLAAGSDIWYAGQTVNGNTDIATPLRWGTGINLQCYSHWDILQVGQSGTATNWNWTWSNCVFHADYYNNMTLAGPTYPLHPAALSDGTNIFQNCRFEVGIPAGNAIFNSGIAVDAYSKGLISTNWGFEVHNCTFNINGPSLTNTSFLYYNIFTNLNLAVFDNLQGIGVPIEAGNWTGYTNFSVGGGWPTLPVKGGLTNAAQNTVTFTNFLLGSSFTNTSTRNDFVSVNARCNPTTTGNAKFALVTSPTGATYTTNSIGGMEADVIFTTAPHPWHQLTAQIPPGGIWKVVDITGEGLVTITNSYYQTLQ